MSYNGVQIPTPTEGLKIAYNNIETVNQSETGTDLVSITRLKKRVYSFTLQITPFWLERVQAIAGQESSTQTFDGESITGRLRLISAELVKDSERLTTTNGLYIITAEFTEI